MTTAPSTPVSVRATRLQQAQLACFLLALFSGNFSVASGQIGLGLTLLLGLVRWLGFRSGPPATGMEGVSLALVVWAVGMIPLSADPGQSLVYSKRFFLFTGLWLGASLATGEHRRRLMFTVLLAGATGVSLVAIVTTWRQAGTLFASRLDHVNNAMTSGAVLMLVVLVAVGVLLSRGLTVRTRLLIGVATAPALLALVMTMTRSALLGLLAGGAIMLLLARPRWLAVGAGLLVVLVLVGALGGDRFVSPRLRARLDPAELVSGANTTGRLDMWRVGWRMIRAHPVTGVGDCDLLELGAAHKGDIDAVPFGHLHSNFVHLAVIWGIPGFLLAMAFLLRQPWLLVRRWRRDGGRATPVAPWRHAWRLGATGMWTGFFVAGLTEWYFGDAEPMLLFMAILGIAMGGRTDRDPAAPASAPARERSPAPSPEPSSGPGVADA